MNFNICIVFEKQFFSQSWKWADEILTRGWRCRRQKKKVGMRTTAID